MQEYYISPNAITNKLPIHKSGDRYNSLIITGKSFTQNGERKVETICDCGNIIWLFISNLRTNHTKSCGCLQSKSLFINGVITTAGKYYNPIYKVWHAMVDRCNNKNNSSYSDYGGRGIVVCDEWVNSFEEFKDWALKNGWEKGLSIERNKNNLGYCPNNCRWVTMAEQSRNKRNNVIISVFGESKCVSEWSRDIRCNISLDALRNRIKRGVNPEKAITTFRNKL